VSVESEVETKGVGVEFVPYSTGNRGILGDFKGRDERRRYSKDQSRAGLDSLDSDGYI
jgi:hypothetical protein